MIKLFHVNVKKLKKHLHAQGKSLHQVTRAMDYHQLDKQLENGRPVTKDTLERLAAKTGLNIKYFVQNEDPYQKADSTVSSTLNVPEKAVDGDKVTVEVTVSHSALEALAIMADFKGDTVDNLIARYVEASAARISQYINDYTD